MYARTIVAYLVPGKADEAIKIFSEQIVPSIRETAEAEAATSKGNEYLAKVVGMLRGCLVNREVTYWEVGSYDQA